MKRDADLLRTMALRIEAADSDGATFDTSEDTDEGRRNALHIALLQDAGYAEFTDIGSAHVSERLTMKGYDFVDSIRDEEAWRQAKAAGSAVKGFTIDMLAALAKGYVKTKIEQHTGIKLDL